MNPQRPSNIERVVAWLCLSGSLSESSVEEWNIVPFVAADSTAHSIPGDHGNLELRLTNDKDRLISLIVPEVATAEFSTTNLQYVAAELLSQTQKLARRKV